MLTKAATCFITLVCVAVCGCFNYCDGDQRSTAEQACRDAIDAFASSVRACPGTGGYQFAYDTAITMIADGDCANVTGLRDEDLFYDTCIPNLNSLPCEQLRGNLSAVEWPVSCRGQLER
jgi:hypothetical protein